MAQEVIRKLYQAFDHLEGAISKARKSLMQQKHVSLDLLERFSHYDELLLKQRRLATKLCTHIVNDEWEKVNAQVRLLNQLSRVIQRDAVAVAHGVQGDYVGTVKDLKKQIGD